MSRLTIDVPYGFGNPIPAEWDADTVGMALKIGVDVVRTCKERDQDERLAGRHDIGRQVLEELKTTINAQHDIVTTATTAQREMETRLVAEKERAIAEVRNQKDRELFEMQNKLDAQQETMRHKIAEVEARSNEQISVIKLERENDAKLHKLQLDAAKEADPDTGLLQKLIVLKEEHSREMRMMQEKLNDCLLKHAHDKDELRKSCHAEAERRLEEIRSIASSAEKRAQQAEEEIASKNAELLRLTIPTNRANEIESSLCKELIQFGLHAYNTSKGNHNKHYHDILVAQCQLKHDVESVFGASIPRYTPNPERSVDRERNAPRCSIEWKGYSRVGKMSHEVEVFNDVRKSMLKGSRADCFVFAASADIPHKGRHEFAVYDSLEPDSHNRSHIRRHCVAYVASKDITFSEIAMVTKVCIEMQSLLDAQAKGASRPLDDQVSRLVAQAHTSMHSGLKHIRRMDNILATAASLSKDVESTRIDLIASVFQQFQSLQQEELQLDEHTVSIRRDYDLMQNNDTRPKECAILNNRDVFDQVKRAVNGASQSQASAIPKVGSKRQRTEL